MRFQTARFEAREWTARRGRKASERGALPMSLVIAFGVLAFFVAWFIGGNLALRRAMRGMASEEGERARSLFTKQREQDKQLLGLLCRVVAGSPPLKAIVDTPGIDEQSISDILSDLRQLTRADMLAVLTPACCRRRRACRRRSGWTGWGAPISAVPSWSPTRPHRPKKRRGCG